MEMGSVVGLVVKAVAAPLLVAGATAAARRFGDKVGGILTAFPMVAGPILVFLAIDQGPAFAAAAARQAVLGVAALTGFCLTYAWVSRVSTWGVSLAAGWVSFALCVIVLRGLTVPLYLALPIAWTVLVVGIGLLPAAEGVARAARHGARGELLVRMAATALLVISVTALAGVLGPSLSGLLTPFPVAATVMAVFTHRRAGSGGVVLMLRGLLGGLTGFTLFCAVFAVTMERMGPAAAVAGGLLVSVAVQGVLLRAAAVSRKGTVVL